MFLARMEVASGAWNVAARLCDEAIELARQTGREMGESLCLMVLAEIDAYRGEAEKARREIPDLLEVAAGVGYSGAIHRLTRALASLELSCGDAGASWRLTAPLFADVTELDEVLATLAGSVGVEALIGVGDLPEARAAAERCSTSTPLSPTPRLRPLADRCRGLLLAAQGDHRAGDRGARGGGRRARPAARGEPVRARPDAARARHRAAPRAAQARRPRDARTGRRELRAARRAPLGGEGARRAAADRRTHRVGRASSRRPSGGSSSSSSPAAGTARSRPSSASARTRSPGTSRRSIASSASAPERSSRRASLQPRRE